MPTAKGKGGSMSHRYRPASEYDDVTLAQKREYWRTKKREQRARLSQRRGKPRDGHGEHLRHLNAHAVVNSSRCVAAPSFQSKDELHKSPASQSRNTVEDSSLEIVESQKEKWFQTMKLNKVLPQLPAACSVSAKAAGGNAATVKCLTKSCAVNRAGTSLTRSGTQPNNSPSVPPVRVSRITNGSSIKATPQPCVSLQGSPFTTMQHKAQAALGTQPKLLPTNVITGANLRSSPCGPLSIKPEGKTANTTPQTITKSALVNPRRAKGVGGTQPPLESEEERAAKRREHWRIKKREQRANLAAQIAKARERMQNVEISAKRQATQKPEPLGNTGLQHLTPPSVLRGTRQKQCPPRVKASFPPTKRENHMQQSQAASLASVNLQRNQLKVQNPHGSRTAQTAITCAATAVKKTDSQRKFLSYGHLSNVPRGVPRCKTQRQRFIEVQRNLMNQRSIRCRSPLLASVFHTRNFPRIDPSDTPEQVIAKRREYWRIKKREQRAKLSMEVKARLKEKDSLMRRVKRYQKILEEMRKARALAQSAGSTLTHTSEIIGGFIKEDGTVSINIPRSVSATRKEENTQPQRKTDAAPVRMNQPVPPLCAAQVKVSFPLAGQAVSKPPTARTQHESTTVSNSHSLASQTVGQLTLTHPQTPLNAISGGCPAGSNLGGCVMKMAVSSTTPSLSAVSVDPELTEEERMAKKREYWRIKKREQRAARAARLKQGVLHARASAALQRRRAPKQVALISIPVSRSLTNRTEKGEALPNSVPVTPHVSEIKQESESMPAVDLNSQPEQAICPDIKPPAFPPSPPPVPLPECDTALSADSQATTLLAVASMKKLLEESLSTVTESQGVQTDIKMETTQEASEDIKPHLPQVFFDKDEVAHVAADPLLQINSWQPHCDVTVQAGSSGPHLRDSSHISETPPPLPASTEVVERPACKHSSQTASDITGEAPDIPSSMHMTQRLRSKKASHQNCCSPEPPKLHHLPTDQLYPQQQHCEQHCQAQEQCHSSSSPQTQTHCQVMTEHSGLTSLQRKREYWKLMKRQQRARLKARQKETQGECSSRLSLRNIQAPGRVVINTVKGISAPAKVAFQTQPSIASLTVMPSVPALLVSSNICNAEQTPGTLQVTPPITSVSCPPRREHNNMNTGPSQMVSGCRGAPGRQQQAIPGSQRWMSASTDVDSAPPLSTLRPPDNPLSSINLQPIEPLGRTPDSTLIPIKVPCAQGQGPTHMMQGLTKLAPASTMVPPKPVPGESEEEFLRRKREYWRIKKKEQRARKAIREKGSISRRISNNWRPVLPAQDLQSQDSGQWANCSEELDHQMCTPVDTDLESFPGSDYPAAEEDDCEVLFTDYENNEGEEGPVSDGVWRNRYLMDYDPLNQLLVCMVCGDLQYSHSLEGVRAHIDDAHPDTLTLEPIERQRILEAWDEQVSQRERFFTSQLQQHSGPLPEAHRN